MVVTCIYKSTNNLYIYIFFYISYLALKEFDAALVGTFPVSVTVGPFSKSHSRYFHVLNVNQLNVCFCWFFLHFFSFFSFLVL